MIGARLWLLLTVAFGLLTFGVFVSFIVLHLDVYQPMELLNDVGAFQQAEKGRLLSSIFDAPSKVDAMRSINIVDFWGFIPAYLVFLVAASLFIGGVRPLTFAAVAAVLVGAGADWPETAAQLRVPTPSAADLPTAMFAEDIYHLFWIKYGALAVHGLAVAIMCFTATQRRLILGALALIPLPLVAAASALNLGMPTEAFTGAFIVFWTALIVAAARELWKPKGAQA